MKKTNGGCACDEPLDWQLFPAATTDKQNRSVVSKRFGPFPPKQTAPYSNSKLLKQHHNPFLIVYGPRPHGLIHHHRIMGGNMSVLERRVGGKMSVMIPQQKFE